MIMPRALPRQERTPLGRARLLAARLYAPGSIPRRAILGGSWDGGAVVGQFLPAAGADD